MGAEYSPWGYAVGGTFLGVVVMGALRLILKQAAGMVTDRAQTKGVVIVNEGYIHLIQGFEREIQRLNSEITRMGNVIDACEARHLERDAEMVLLKDALVRAGIQVPK